MGQTRVTWDEQPQHYMGQDKTSEPSHNATRHSTVAVPIPPVSPHQEITACCTRVESPNGAERHVMFPSGKNIKAVHNTPGGPKAKK